ncbi:dTDP-4-dehydrorhamnose reductase [Pontiella agarivorans]|uniref:dTDP-4-dehydrorhamnose reductase n=1 Tax=Pontiella agarivorans TaxID=3038953 RepID=A0ABU5MSY0_9BACT|nr:dTDP-4-dehydrorhamnose reductase [Pontiella agarivorans]MDZ8117312.1 dTDP-4-dehydrorhamnose reductase [Pontiella agarivorans]
MQKILITGAGGQLGSDCLRTFSNAGEVVGLDLPEVDLSDRDACRAALDRIKPGIVVNCAAFTAVDVCETDPSCWKGNRDLPKNLAEWCGANGAFLAHVSTDYVFPGDKPLFQALEESERPNPISEYGRSKLAGEQAVTEATDRFAILRTAWLYGANGNNFLKTMLRLTLQHPGKTFKVVNDQYGSPTWSMTLAKQIRAVVDAEATGIFHASSEGYCTWYDLASSFLDQLNIEHHFVPCTSDEFPTPTKRPQNSILENGHAKALGLNIFKDWKTELDEFVRMHGETVIEEIRAL